MTDPTPPAAHGESTPARRSLLARALDPAAALITLALLLAVGAGALLVASEVRTSRLQAAALAALGARLTYAVEPGASDRIRFPHSGPYDLRLGYSQLPEFAARLEGRGYAIAAQARISPALARVVDAGLYAPYDEKSQAGLMVLACDAAPLYRARYPQRMYPNFDAVPRLLVESLLFIENRELLDASEPTKNPAVEWDRFTRALFDQAIRVVDEGHEAPGGSTLATQIEKYRHSPDGRTASAQEKLRQMASASVRAYLHGEDTTAARRNLVVEYLNSVPLAAKTGSGEIYGLGDGLRAWYGRDFDQFNRLVANDDAPLAARALAYKQALSLLVAERRPSYYLLAAPQELEELTDRHLRVLAAAGVIAPALRDAALGQKLHVDASAAREAAESFVSRKAANAVRTHLSALLGLPRLYDLDRLDLTVTSTLDADLQRAATDTLRALRQPAAAQAAGLMEYRLLAGSDPAKVIYSFTLYERSAGANLVRVQTDNYDQPFDINEGTKLDLGSTAKLRTLISYLQIVERLHERLGGLTPKELAAVRVAAPDAITRWAIGFLSTARDRSLAAMLAAAMERRYSANPGERFFTGGGVHQFENFDPADNGRTATVREAVRRSINLVFVRLMRDIVRHEMFNIPSSSATLLEDADDPKRRAYLARFADQEGSEFIRRFYRKYQRLPAAGIEEALLAGVHAEPARLAVIFRTLEPDANATSFALFLAQHLPGARLSPQTIERLYTQYAPQRFDLADRGYLARVHPLELWLAAYLRQHPDATVAQALEASAAERQAVYKWLFSKRLKRAQDSRIRTLVEQEAFLEIHRAWKRLGYPFASLVPSYATALGASADRPAALAELMGIVVNDGVRLPTVRIGALDFASGTPYETQLRRRPDAGERVLAPQIARVVRSALAEVVEQGTARRLKDVFRAADGTPLAVGGKTGTGDNRFEEFGKGGQLISSRVVSRSGTFVFYIGDRYFGTLTAYVRGPQAAKYSFTSALPVQILKALAGKLGRLDEPACRYPTPMKTR
jgi:membrane peptidoglycan carboxypeptidase